MRAIILANYAPHAVKGLIQGSDREAAIRALTESVGGKLESVMFTRGAYDIAVTFTVPDQAAGLGVAMAVRASGSLSEVQVLEELDIKPILAAAQTAAKAYKPAG